MASGKKAARAHEFNLPSDVAEKAAPKAAVVKPRRPRWNVEQLRPGHAEPGT